MTYSRLKTPTFSRRLLIFALSVHQRQTCVREMEIYSTARTNDKTHFRNLNEVELVRFENAMIEARRSFHLSRHDLPKLRRIEFLTSPDVECAWFREWVAVDSVVRLGYCFTPYQRLWLYNGAPLVAFYDTLGIRRSYSRGFKSRMCPPYPHACRKRRLKWGAVI